MKKLLLLFLLISLYSASAFAQTYSIKVNKKSETSSTLTVEVLLLSEDTETWNVDATVQLTGGGSIGGTRTLGLSDGTTIGGGNTPLKLQEVGFSTDVVFTKNGSTDAASFTVYDDDPLGVITPGASGNPDIRLTRTGTVNCIISPSVTIASNVTNMTNNNNVVCKGSPVTFTATPYHGGTAPNYQWKVNDMEVQNSTLSTYETFTLSNANEVTVVMTSDLTGPFSCVETVYNLALPGVKATPTAPITMIVNPVPVVTVSSPSSIVYGTTGTIDLVATLTVTPVSPVPNSGTVQFSVDGTPVSDPVTVVNGVATLTGYNPSLLSATNHVISATYSGTDTYSSASGFCPASSTTPTNGTLTITPRPLSVVLTKVYDGNAGFDFNITIPSLGNVVNGDIVALTGGIAILNKNVGQYASNAISLATLFISNPNYRDFSSWSINITAKELTIATAAASNKVYDGNENAVVTGTLTGVVGTEDVTFSGTGTFADANIGTAKVVTSTSTLGGVDAGNNYTLTQPTGLTADITAKALTIAGVTANNKPYDGTTAATLSGTAAYVGLVNGETFAVTGTPVATFASANVGNAIAVTVTGYTAPSTNYTLTQPTGLTANITGKELTVTGATADNKIYDGGVVATISGATLVGIVSPDVVTVSGGGTFASANVADGIAVTPSLVLGGANAGNYTLTQPTGLTANITGKALSITATNQSKCFNSLFTFAGTEFTTSGLVSGTGDAVTNVTLNSTGAALLAIPGIPHPIVPDAAVGTGLSNYTIIYTNGILTVNALPIASITGITTICTGTTTTLTAAGSDQYNWNGAGFSATATFTTPELTSNTPYSVTVKNTATTCVSLPATVTVIANDCAPKLAIKVALDGAYNTTTGLMNDGLRSNGKIPSAQPYNAMIFAGNSPTSAYNGTETVAPSVLAVSTGDTAVVDWVLVEVRQVSVGNAIVVASRAGLLRKDGKIVDVDGYSPLRFGDLRSANANDYFLNGNYHISVRHRLCLGTRTQTAVYIGLHDAAAVATTNVDFTTGASTGLTGSRKLLSNNKYALYMGDTDRSGVISATDVTNVRLRNPTIPSTFNYANFGYDLDFNASIFSSDVSIARSSSTLFQVALNQ